MTENTKFRKLSSKNTVMVAGLLSAACTFYGLSLSPTLTKPVANTNPVVTEVLKQAKGHLKKGRWNEAADILKNYATADHPEILLEYGRMQARGWGMTKDLDEARRKLLLAVQHEFPERGYAAFELAKVYEKSTGKDCTRIAFEWYNKAASWGFTKAHVELGRMYTRGLGVETDFAMALQHYQLGAQFGSAQSLLQFIGLVQDLDEKPVSLPDLKDLLSDAIPKLEREVFEGKAASAKALGRLYFENKLMPPDLAQAELWLRRSVRLGDVGAMPELAVVLLKNPQNEQSRSQAIDLLKAAVSVGHAGAKTELARLYLQPEFKLPRKEAVPLLQQAVAAKHAGGMLELARLYLLGDLVKQDRKAALALLKRSAATGHQGSKSLLKKVQESEGGNLDIKDIITSGKPFNVQMKVNPPPPVQYINWSTYQQGQQEALRNRRENQAGQTKPMTGATFVTRIEKRG